MQLMLQAEMFLFREGRTIGKANAWFVSIALMMVYRLKLCLLLFFMTSTTMFPF